jgi:Zn finger protein HypA/HybF involved in hydrogenase expression
VPALLVKIAYVRPIVLTDFTRFVIVPNPAARPSREYRAFITCTECDWSGEEGLRTNEVQRLLCGGCGNIEKAYLGIPDEFVGVPCPECDRAATRLERVMDAMGRIEILRLYCPQCDWEL